jgi:hypothetical protein
MFPFRYSSIFRSRWIALFWAAGIIWWALDVAEKPKAQDDQPTANATAPDANAAAAAKLLEKLAG